MAKTLENIRLYGDLPSSVWVAPVGTVFPTDLSPDLPAPWVEIGWLSDDGIDQERKVESATFTAYQGGTVVRKRVTSTDNTRTFAALEETLTVFGLYNTGTTAVTEAGGLTRLTVPAGTGVDERAYIFDYSDGDYLKRELITRGEVTDRDKISNKNDELTVYALTTTIYGDFDVLTNNPALAPAAA